jgi:hypothetical protein
MTRPPNGRPRRTRRSDVSRPADRLPPPVRAIWRCPIRRRRAQWWDEVRTAIARSPLHPLTADALMRDRRWFVGRVVQPRRIARPRHQVASVRGCDGSAGVAARACRDSGVHRAAARRKSLRPSGRHPRLERMTNPSGSSVA